MRTKWIAAGLLACGCCAGVAQEAPARSHGAAGLALRLPALRLHAARLLPTDLEVEGRFPGEHHAYARRADLLSLPQVQFVVDDDPDLPGIRMQVSGIPLAELARAVRAPAQTDLLDLTCTDKYRAYYPADMIAAHGPVLVLSIDGMDPKQWATTAKQDDPGPYLVLYPNFRPAWRVLAHQDRPQLPTNVVRVTFESQTKAFGRIAPPARDAANAAVQQGYRIAAQNCIRCHAEGETGGTKSGRSWADLARDARSRPDWFQHFVVNPKAATPGASMPGNPDYDAVTTQALAAYFRTFAEAR